MNQFKHIDAIEYATGYFDGLRNNGEMVEEYIEQWHKRRAMGLEMSGNGPTSYQLAYLRGLEAAEITLNKGVAAMELIETVTLDQSGDGNGNEIDGIRVEKFYPDNAARIRGNRRG